MPHPLAGKRVGGRCSAKSSRTGNQCKRPAILGGTVCLTHGGSAPQVKQAAQRRLQVMLNDILDPNRVLEEIACLAFFDPAVIYDKDGDVLPVREWPESARRALAGLDVAKRNITAGDGVMDTVLKVKFWPKDKALDMAAKHHALLTEKVEHQGAIEVKWQSSE